MGLLALPAALGAHTDVSLLMLGACAISAGSIMAASGIYVKARAVEGAKKGSSAADPRNPARRVRGGCDVCHGDLPVIHCKVHQAHLCANCLGQHFDPRDCRYVPSSRRTVGKNKPDLAKAHGA